MEGCRNLECILFLLVREQTIYFLIFGYNQPIFKSSLKFKKKKKSCKREKKKEGRVVILKRFDFGFIKIYLIFYQNIPSNAVIR